MEGEAAATFRALAARVSFLAQDCPYLQFPAKVVCRKMAVPTQEAWVKLKRLAGYLLTRVAVTFRYEWQDEGQPMVVYADSDWAGCKRTRKSPSGEAILVGSHCIKTWSSTQSTVSQSSGEAECYALVRVAMEALGVQSIMNDLGWSPSIRLWFDSSAAKSISSRIGLGRVRHFGSEIPMVAAGSKGQALGCSGS